MAVTQPHRKARHIVFTCPECGFLGTQKVHSDYWLCCMKCHKHYSLKKRVNNGNALWQFNTKWMIPNFQ